MGKIVIEITEEAAACFVEAADHLSEGMKLVAKGIKNLSNYDPNEEVMKELLRVVENSPPESSQEGGNTLA